MLVNAKSGQPFDQLKVSDMLTKLHAVDLSSDDEAFYTALGKFMMLVGTTHPFSEMPVALSMSLVHGALLNRTYCLYLDRHKKPAGGLIWAFLDEKTAQHYLDFGVLPSLNSWRSGNQLWFLNVVAEGGLVRKVMKDAKDELFGEYDRGYMLRRSPGGERRVVEMTRHGAAVVRKMPPIKPT